MAGVARAHGRPERAAGLLATAAVHLGTRGAALEQTGQMEYDRELADTKSHLDGATFAATWGAARAMSTAVAIAYALEDAAPN